LAFVRRTLLIKLLTTFPGNKAIVEVSDLHPHPYIEPKILELLDFDVLNEYASIPVAVAVSMEDGSNTDDKLGAFLLLGTTGPLECASRSGTFVSVFFSHLTGQLR